MIARSDKPAARNRAPSRIPCKSSSEMRARIAKTTGGAAARARSLRDSPCDHRLTNRFATCRLGRNEPAWKYPNSSRSAAERCGNSAIKCSMSKVRRTRRGRLGSGMGFMGILRQFCEDNSRQTSEMGIASEIGRAASVKWVFLISLLLPKTTNRESHPRIGARPDAVHALGSPGLNAALPIVFRESIRNG